MSWVALEDIPAGVPVYRMSDDTEHLYANGRKVAKWVDEYQTGIGEIGYAPDAPTVIDAKETT